MTTPDEGSSPQDPRYVTRVDAPGVTERDLAADIASLSAQNRRLVSTLQQAREQIVTLKTEIDQLAQPPSGFAIFIGANDDSTVDVFANGRKMRIVASPDVDVSQLEPGQEVILNEAMNVVKALSFEKVGEIVMLKELLEDGERALVLGHSDDERVVRLADPLLKGVVRAGDSSSNVSLSPRLKNLFSRKSPTSSTKTSVALATRLT
jgi:proteasome-associated ATPase